MSNKNYSSKKEPCLTSFVEQNLGRLNPYDGLFLRRLKFECNDNFNQFIIQGSEILWNAVMSELHPNFYRDKTFDYIYPAESTLKKSKKIKKFGVDSKKKDSFLMLLKNHVDAYGKNDLDVMTHIMGCNCVSAYQGYFIRTDADNIMDEKLTNIVLESHFLYNFLKNNFKEKTTLWDKLKQWK